MAPLSHLVALALTCVKVAHAGSCAQYGCSNSWVPGRDCQCNPACVDPQYNNCCSDYHKVCTPSPPPPLPPAPALPRSCAELAYTNPSYADGEYRLQCDAVPITVFCADMRGDSPREFLTLHNSGPNTNVASYLCGSNCKSHPEHPDQSTVVTVYSKIRINPCTLMVDITETTFATSKGKITHGNVAMEFEPFGIAESCEFSDTGKANVDLSATSFVLDTVYRVGGASPTGAFHIDAAKQVANITGGGYCGHNGPTAWDAFKPRTEPQWIMQLGLRVGSPRSPVRPTASAATTKQRTAASSTGMSGSWIGYPVLGKTACDCTTAAVLNRQTGAAEMRTACLPLLCNDPAMVLVAGIATFSIVGPDDRLLLLTKTSSSAAFDVGTVHSLTATAVDGTLKMCIGIPSYPTPCTLEFRFASATGSYDGSWAGALDYPASQSPVAVYTVITGALFTSVAFNPSAYTDTTVSAGIIQLNTSTGTISNTFLSMEQAGRNTSLPVGTQQMGLFEVNSNGDTMTIATRYPGVPGYPASIHSPGTNATRVVLTKQA